MFCCALLYGAQSWTARPPSSSLPSSLSLLSSLSISPPSLPLSSPPSDLFLMPFQVFYFGFVTDICIWPVWDSHVAQFMFFQTDIWCWLFSDTSVSELSTSIYKLSTWIKSFIHLYHLSAVAVLANRSPRESVTVSAAAGSKLARINCILNCLNQRGECF